MLIIWPSHDHMNITGTSYDPHRHVEKCANSELYLWEVSQEILSVCECAGMHGPLKWYRTPNCSDLLEAVRSLPLPVLVPKVPFLLRVSLHVWGCFNGTCLEGDVRTGGVQVSEGHQVHKELDSICIKKKFHILFVVEQLVHKHQQAVSLRLVLTLQGGWAGSNTTYLTKIQPIRGLHFPLERKWKYLIVDHL